MESFIQHGKLLFRQLTDLCITRLFTPTEEGAEGANTNADPSEKQLEEARKNVKKGSFLSLIFNLI